MTDLTLEQVFGSPAKAKTRDRVEYRELRTGPKQRWVTVIIKGTDMAKTKKGSAIACPSSSISGVRQEAKQSGYDPKSVLRAVRRAMQGGGYAVYVMSLSDKKCCKIGFSQDPVSRMRNIQTGQDSKVYLYFSIRLEKEDARYLESAIHRYLMNTINHKFGEWYLIEAENAAQIVVRMARHLHLQFSPDLTCGSNRGLEII